MNQISPFIALLVTVLFLSVLVSRFGKTIQDIPNDRSLHHTPVPRTGGIALVLGVSAGWGFLAESIPWWLWLPCLMLFVVSLLDDIRNLPVKQRLFAHLAAACQFCFNGRDARSALFCLKRHATFIYVISG